jgi:hypothetical protein
MRWNKGAYAHRSVICSVIVPLIMTAAGVAPAQIGTVLYPLTPPSDLASAVPSTGEPQAAAEGQTVGYGGANGGQPSGVLWSPSGVDLQPATGFENSEALGTDGAQQVGYGYSTGNLNHALLWSGTAASVVDLNPSGFAYSYAIAICGMQQVGLGLGTPTGLENHALIWSKTAASASDVNPTNIPDIEESALYGTDGAQQVGWGYGAVATAGNDHAMLWSETANSAVDLNPAGFAGSFANGVSGTQQVGYGFVNVNSNHAFLWSGTAASAIDLTPAGFDNAVANGTNGTDQVGYGEGSGTGNNNHALWWSGTAGSFVDLQLLLPAAGTWTDSIAYTIDPAGNVFGTADGTFGNVTGTFAVEWSVPEPAAGSLLLIAGAGILMRRRKQMA